MAHTVVVQPVEQRSFCDGIPFFFGSVPKKVRYDQEIPGDWCHVEVEKVDKAGERWGTDSGEPFRYLMENSTGDLYGIQGEAPFSRPMTAVKCAGLCVGTPFYAICMVAWRIINFTADCTECILQMPAAFACSYRGKGLLLTLLETAIGVGSCFLHSLAENVAAVVKIPFYATALSFAALYGVLIPFEGMKWVGYIESRWHGGVSYRADVRYRNRSLLSATLFEEYAQAREGGVLFLAFCMQKRGNIGDRIKGKYRFALIKNKKK